MFFERVYDETLAQASYVIGCQSGGVAAVIDPKRDIDTYLEIAEKNQLKITKVLETHIHADFLCGSRELAHATGAEIFVSDEGDEDWKYDFSSTKLKDGNTINLGNLSIEALHTPGHTPEHLSYKLIDHPATDAPIMLFTGDDLFLGDVGRPDLLEQAAGIQGTQEEGAKALFQSLSVFTSMPDYVQVWPGHGSGSACGKALGAVPSSTIGYEKIRNWALQLLDHEKKFTQELLEDQPEPPTYFAKMKQLNKEQRPVLSEIPEIKHLNQTEWNTLKAEGKMIVDTRKVIKYREKHLKTTINIPNNKSLSTWMGWFADYDDVIALVATEDEIKEIARKLMRIGLDHNLSYITPDELLKWEKENLSNYKVIEKSEVKKLMKDEDVQVIDVRGASEYKENHIDGAKNIFVGNLEENIDQIPTHKQLIIHCQTGARAAIAHSILQKNGIQNSFNYAGGMDDWLED